MNDLISKSTLLNIMQKLSEREHGTPLSMIKWFMEVITVAPTVEPYLFDWIPCSKRLPNQSDNNINDSALSIPVLVKYDSEEEPEVLHYNTFTEKFCYDQVDVTNEVVAWMPLPGENAKYFYNNCKNKILEVANGFTFTDKTQQRQYMEFLEYCLENAFEENKNE